MRPRTSPDDRPRPCVGRRATPRRMAHTLRLAGDQLAEPQPPANKRPRNPVLDEQAADVRGDGTAGTVLGHAYSQNAEILSMSHRTSKRSRTLATGISVLALVAGAALPSGAFAQTAASASASAADSDVWNRNANGAIQVDALLQRQDVDMGGGSQDVDQRLKQNNDSEAKAFAIGGDTKAVGNVAIVTFKVSQDTDASVAATISPTIVTGRAGGDASASGAISANGGDGSQNATTSGGDGNGNSIAASLAAPIASGNSAASNRSIGGDGGYVDQDTDGGKAYGGDSDADSGGNGNRARAGSLAAALVAALGVSDGHGGDVPDAAASSGASNSADSGAATSGAGGAATGGAATSTGTGGAGGAATGTGTSSATLTNTAGAATAGSPFNNGNATAALTGTRNGAGGDGNGNVAAGGAGSSGSNGITSNVVGGVVQNSLGISFSQTGTVTATGGSTSNTGSATSTPSNSGSNTSTSTRTQTQTPSQTGTTGSNTSGQTASATGTSTSTSNSAARAAVVTPTH